MKGVGCMVPCLVLSVFTNIGSLEPRLWKGGPWRAPLWGIVPMNTGWIGSSLLNQSCCSRTQPQKYPLILHSRLFCAKSTRLLFFSKTHVEGTFSSRGSLLSVSPPEPQACDPQKEGTSGCSISAAAPRLGPHRYVLILTLACFCVLHMLEPPGFLAQNRWEAQNQEAEEVSQPWELSARFKSKKERRESEMFWAWFFCTLHCLCYCLGIVSLFYWGRNPETLSDMVKV